MLQAAQRELREIGRYLTLRDVIWHSFWHRNERGVLKPYWRLRHRQSFHDGVCLAQLLVAVRQTLNEEEARQTSNEKKADPLPHGLRRLLPAVRHAWNAQPSHHNPVQLLVAVRQMLKADPLPRPQKVLRIATAIAGESSCIAGLLGIRYAAPKWSGQKEAAADSQAVGTEEAAADSQQSGQKKPPQTVKRRGRKNPPTMVKRLRTRRWPWQYSTPSWPAAYNLACVYAAIGADRNQRLEACLPKPEDKSAMHKADCLKDELKCLVGKVVTSLEFAITNPECEMERPSEWIDSDPDIACLYSLGKEEFSVLRDFLANQKQRDYPPSAAAVVQGWPRHNLATT